MTSSNDDTNANSRTRLVLLLKVVELLRDVAQFLEAHEVMKDLNRQAGRLSFEEQQGERSAGRGRGEKGGEKGEGKGRGGEQFHHFIPLRHIGM